MAEEKPRIQEVTTYVYGAEELVIPKEIADAIGESSLNVGKDLHELQERHVAESPEGGQWEITDSGREYRRQ